MPVDKIELQLIKKNIPLQWQQLNEEPPDLSMKTKGKTIQSSINVDCADIPGKTEIKRGITAFRCNLDRRVLWDPGGTYNVYRCGLRNPKGQ